MKVYRDKKNGHYWEESNGEQDIEKAGDSRTAVYPLGGGFLHFIPKSELEEAEVPKDKISGWATFDDDENVYKCIYNPHYRWNGWHQPLFTKSVVDKIVENWDGTLVKDDMFSTDTEDCEHWRLLGRHETLEEDEGIYVFHYKKTGMWELNAVCWQCHTDEELDEFGKRWEIKHIQHA